MRWKKLGQVFSPNNNFEWMVSHASNPLAEQLEDSIHRIYFSCRDVHNRSSIGYIDLDLHRPNQILNISASPVIAPGDSGYFDDSGVTVGNLVHLDDGQRYLYYLGWNLCVTVPFRNTIGLALSRSKGEPFCKFDNGRAPIMDRSARDPLTFSYPWVLKEKDRWRMWYGSNLSWANDKYEMVSVLKYAESNDGILWNPLDEAILSFKDESEHIMSRPCILKMQGVYKMWYSIRGLKYRICYAESQDGKTWERLDDQTGISMSNSGWDSESVEYCSVFIYDKQMFMLYNGNDYGRTGFGLATLEGFIA